LRNTVQSVHFATFLQHGRV